MIKPGSDEKQLYKTFEDVEYTQILREALVDGLVKVAIIIFLITAASVMRDWVKINRYENARAERYIYFDKKKGEYVRGSFNRRDLDDDVKYE